MADETLPIAMLRSALTVLTEAARQAEREGVLDRFYELELPLAVEDAEAALSIIENTLPPGSQRAA